MPDTARNQHLPFKNHIFQKYFALPHLELLLISENLSHPRTLQVPPVTKCFRPHRQVTASSRLSHFGNDGFQYRTYLAQVGRLLPSENVVACGRRAFRSGTECSNAQLQAKARNLHLPFGNLTFQGRIVLTQLEWIQPWENVAACGRRAFGLGTECSRPQLPVTALNRLVTFGTLAFRNSKRFDATETSVAKEKCFVSRNKLVPTWNGVLPPAADRYGCYPALPVRKSSILKTNCFDATGTATAIGKCDISQST